MSITLKSGKEICNAPTNTSKSKQQYSFSKAPRFPLSKLNKGHTDQYYSLPNIHSTRSTNMGFGNRYDFTASQKNINSKFMETIQILLLNIHMDLNFHLQMEEINMKKFILEVQFQMIKMFLDLENIFFLNLLVGMLLNFLLKENTMMLKQRLKIFKKMKKKGKKKI